MPSASAPGKIHLIGEHAVVYGKPAILASIDRRVFCSVVPDKKIRILSEGFGSLSAKPGDCIEFARLLTVLHKNGKFKRLFGEVRKSPSSSLKALAGKAMLELGINDGFTAKIKTRITPNSGLGSSAAVSLSFVKALSPNSPPRKVYDVSLEIENLFHGRPSGADTAVCQRGGMIWFEKGKVRSLKFVKRNALLVKTKRESTTGELVSRVRKTDERKRNPIMDEIAMLSKEMKRAVAKRGNEKMAETFNFAQSDLRALGISTEKIDKICAVVRRNGGGAKISGAGGGGHVICVHDDLAFLRRKLSGYKTEIVSLGERGLG